ncbi:MAG TPA: ATP-binding protein [Cyclobacteriaceae bacterium]|nr:ATP-binding protein [Cyclobacteriaceae bacterium]
MSYQQLTNIERFLIGNKPGISSVGEYRRVLLVSQLCVLGVISCIIYSVIDLSFGFYTSSFIYGGALLFCLVSFVLNRIQQHKAAKLILLILANISIFLFSAENQYDAGNYLLYFPLLLLAFAFFDYHELFLSILFAMLSFLLFLTDHLTGFSLLNAGSLPTDLLQVLKGLNFSVSYIVCLLLVFYLVQTNHISESYVFLHQRQLNDLTHNLMESEQRYELAMTGTNAGIWDWDLKNNKIYHGQRWKEMLGYSGNDNLNISIDDFYNHVHPGDVGMVKEALKQHFEKKVPYNIEYRIKTKDGDYEWFYDAGKAIWDASDKPVRMVGSIINVTSRKKDEERIRQQNEMLEKANAELDRFVYITSHDLKAPLLSLIGLINLAEISDKKSEIELCHKMMRDRIKGLESFITDIIEYSRHVRVGLIKETIYLRRLIESIINDFIYMTDVNKIKFEIDISPDFKFTTDEKRITVIMKNLISNAIKYQNYDQENPVIRISARQLDGNIISITVRDNGEGIDTEIQEKIFEMFFRGTEKSNGSGLGLYIVKEMTDKLNGKIEVISSPGKGAEFIVNLPALA